MEVDDPKEYTAESFLLEARESIMAIFKGYWEECGKMYAPLNQQRILHDIHGFYNAPIHEVVKHWMGELVKRQYNTSSYVDFFLANVFGTCAALDQQGNPLLDSENKPIEVIELYGSPEKLAIVKQALQKISELILLALKNAAEKGNGGST